MVTSTGSGLSVPDWPNTYGWFMFTFPMSKWVGGIIAKENEFDEAVKSAAVPPGGVPLELQTAPPQPGLSPEPEASIRRNG